MRIRRFSDILQKALLAAIGTSTLVWLLSTWSFAEELGEESQFSPLIRNCVAQEYQNKGRLDALVVAKQNGYGIVFWAIEPTNPNDRLTVGLAFLKQKANDWGCEYAEKGFPHPRRIIEERRVSIPENILLDLYDKIYPNWNQEVFGVEDDEEAN